MVVADFMKFKDGKKIVSVGTVGDKAGNKAQIKVIGFLEHKLPLYLLKAETVVKLRHVYAALPKGMRFSCLS